MWLSEKWKTKVNGDSLTEATLPVSLVEDQEDTYEAIALGSKVSVVVGEEPPLD